MHCLQPWAVSPTALTAWPDACNGQRLCHKPRPFKRTGCTICRSCLVASIVLSRSKAIQSRMRAHPAFQVSTQCGLETNPFQLAEVAVSGEQPANTFVQVASTTGLKRRHGNINQDCVVARCDDRGRWSLIVADGHGKCGHQVAAHLCAILPDLLEKAIQTDHPTDSIKKAFAEAEADLEAAAVENGFDLITSGASVVTASLTEEGTCLASCGDSQALIVDAEGIITTSRQHKAHDTKEQQRIVAAGGSIKVERPRCRNTVMSRVYGRRSYGLAMSRSFGDLCVKPVGVVAEPSVSMARHDKALLILGSDGLFEFLAPVEVLATLRSSRKEELASALVQEAQSRWERNEAGLYCDDVSCLLVGPDCLSDFLDNPRVRQPALLVNPFGAESYDGPVGAY
ncbi:unnamed protein product [Symbiodinium necroappetens]|uniref:PPM-type phosphatase domain-containing protein n=1 Tax=Symbiodinium necroappetens TaxID=1628268 RepID=A0A812NQK1_9DINO|nr:unnamed protein product [Symbiodinium necroappetens]